MSTLTREKLQEELKHIPDTLLGELYEYMKYLQYKMHQKSSVETAAVETAAVETAAVETAAVETAYASETVLGKDWNRKEEDQAWKDL